MSLLNFSFKHYVPHTALYTTSGQLAPHMNLEGEAKGPLPSGCDLALAEDTSHA